MKPSDLSYERIKPVLRTYEDKGREESASFLNWVLENIFRLDPVAADDVICDRPNDRGIDGIYADHDQEEILVFQSKVRQRESSIGDLPLRELAGAISQLDDNASVQALLDGGGNQELKNVLVRNNIRGLVSQGYNVLGVFVSNQPLDANGLEFLNQDGNLRVYDRVRIASEYIDIESEGGITGVCTFDASYVEPMVIKTGDRATTYIFPVLASELVAMEGIDDGTLFSQNVRQSLGNTKVNRALKQSVLDDKQHQNFPLYHNGVTVLCSDAAYSNGILEISNYVVVNGAQSISTFKRVSDRLSSDLRVLAKVVQLRDPELARRITINSNNQNSIRPRDLKSTNEIQLRLREEFKSVMNGEFDLEIKRGQESREGATVITNEEAGRLLLAFDLSEPESCHQIYKLFDEKYSDIFARPAVNAWRIVLLHLIMCRIQEALEDIEFRPLAKYGLTRFFLLSVVNSLMNDDEVAQEFARNPKRVFEERKVDTLCRAVEVILRAVIIDLNYEVDDLGENFDYKSDLKSPSKIRELEGKLLRSYQKDIARKKAPALCELLE